MKKFMLLILTIMVSMLFATNVFAEELYYSDSIFDTENIESVLETSDGGYIYQDSDYDSGQTFLYIKKFDKDNVLEWETSFSENEDKIISIKNIFEDSDGNYVTIADGCDSKYFSVLIKLDESGNIIYRKDFGNEANGDVKVFKVFQALDSSYIIFGLTEATNITDFSKELDNPTIFMLKYDTNGNLLMAKNFEGNYDYNAIDYYSLFNVLMTTDGKFITAAYISEYHIDKFNNTETPYGEEDIQLMKFDSNGNILFEKYYGGSDEDYVYSAILTDDNNVLLAVESCSLDFLGNTTGDDIYGIMYISGENGNVISYFIDNFDHYAFFEIDNNIYVHSYNNDSYEYVIEKVVFNENEINYEIIPTTNIFENYFNSTIYHFPLKNSYEYLVISWPGLRKISLYYDIKTPTGYMPQNGSMIINGFKAKAGSIVKPEFNPNTGYEFDKLLVNGVPVVGNNFEIHEDSEIAVLFKPIQYKFTNGMDSVYEGEDLEFKLNGEYSLFDKVFINDIELDTDNYTVASGSTIITLKDDYLKELEAGTYNLRVTYTTGAEDTTTFTINAPEEETPITDNEETQTTPKVDNPQTGDNVVLYIVIGLISVIGIAGTTIYTKKRFN